MHTPPRVRGGLTARTLSLVFGLFLFAGAIVCQLESTLGLSPWDTLHQGLAKHTPISFGVANICVGAVVMTAAWALGAKVGVGTISNAILVGGFIQGLTAIPAVEHLSNDGLGVRIALLAASMPLYGIATALYIGAWFGAGPRDSLMVILTQRTGIRFGVVRTGIELAALGGGFALGGKIGVGTAVFALTIGPAVEAGFWLLQGSRIGEPGLAPSPLPAPLAGS